MTEQASAAVWVLDTSSIVRIETAVPQAAQWNLFKHLEAMVEQSLITFPKHVRDEADGLAHPDAPGVWAVGVYGSIKLPTEPDYVHVQTVMGGPASKVVDPDKVNEDADPYVIALALHLMALGHNACVVTDDKNDLPTRIAMTKACDHVSVPWCGLAEFLAEVVPAD